MNYNIYKYFAKKGILDIIFFVLQKYFNNFFILFLFVVYEKSLDHGYFFIGYFY
jgi:hypothetical protein